MDRFRNPNPRGESFSPGDDDTVEGHTMAINRPEDEEKQGSTDDVEGHGVRSATEEDEDVEGHGMRSATEEEDVEGHAWKA